MKEKKERREERNWKTGKREELVCLKVSVFQESGEVFIRGKSSEVINMPD